MTATSAPQGGTVSSIAVAPTRAPKSVAQDLACGIVPGGAGDAAARVGSRATHIQTRQWTPVVGMAQRGAGRKKLIQAQRAMKYIASDQPERTLQVQRAEDLA